MFASACGQQPGTGVQSVTWALLCLGSSLSQVCSHLGTSVSGQWPVTGVQSLGTSAGKSPRPPQWKESESRQRPAVSALTSPLGGSH